MDESLRQARRIALLAAEVSDARDMVGGIFDAVSGLLEASVAHGIVSRPQLARVLDSVLDWQQRAERDEPNSVNWNVRKAPVLALRDAFAEVEPGKAVRPRRPQLVLVRMPLREKP